MLTLFRSRRLAMIRSAFLCVPGWRCFRPGSRGGYDCLTENFAEITRAAMLMAAMMSTRVRAAPHILSNAAPVLPALYMSSMNSGSEDCDWPNGFQLMMRDVATRISIGADSPMMRAMASMMPVTMPDSAVGRTILTIVFHFGTPRA